MEFLTPSELLTVLKVSREHSARDHLMILFAYSHGLRAGEVCRVRLTDISDGAVTFARLKGSKTTVQPLEVHRGQPLLDEAKGLREWLWARPTDSGDYLFPSGKGGCLSTTQFYRLFNRYAVLAGLPAPKAHPHVLKHSLANHLVRQGLNVAHIQQRLGHAAIGSTMRYITLNDSEVSTKVHNSLMEVFK